MEGIEDLLEKGIQCELLTINWLNSVPFEVVDLMPYVVVF